MALSHAEMESILDENRSASRSLFMTMGYGIIAAVLFWAWQGAEINPMNLIKYSDNMVTFVSDFFPPNFMDWPTYLSEMVTTIQIAIWGSLLAVVFSIPAGLMCASNIAPAWIYQPVRRIMDTFRAINEIAFAMLFVVAVGLGPFAGVLALFVHTLGTLAKLFSEAVESIDPQPVEGIRATGANKVEEIAYGVIPQVMPLWISYSLYRFEANVRSATVVGMVGAGGIGYTFYELMRGFYYDQVAAVFIIIIATVSTLDMISAQIRKRFI